MANDFESLFAARKKSRKEQPVATETPAAKQSNKQSKKRSAIAEPPQESIATPEPSTPPSPAPEPTPDPKPEPTAQQTAQQTTEPAPEPEPAPKKKKRGRPATGKRSNAGWIGRTYYIQEKTDIEIEIELATMRRQGVSLDKSELVDALLGAWVAWRKGEDANEELSEFSPRRKDE
ncbi:MAG: hypothetical protein AAF171_17780 [Cyanobacteria bacterium P01_A01_bin.116]